MRSLQKAVYYCDFCSKHALTAHSIKRHETTCTMNPKRTCRWDCSERDVSHADANESAGTLAAALRAKPCLAQGDISELRDVTDGCPACMLAALRQSGHEFHHDSEFKILFDYDKEIETFNADQQEQLLWEERNAFTY